METLETAMKAVMLVFCAICAALLFGVRGGEAREITVELAANPVNPDSAHGHAWVIIAVKDNGVTKVTGYGWYPLKDYAHQDNLGKLHILFGGFAGVDGVPGTLRETDLYREGYVYLQKRISESEYTAVQNVINQQLEKPSDTAYEGFVDNCVTFSNGVAKAIGLNTPWIGGKITYPQDYAAYLIEHNKGTLTPRQWQRIIKDEHERKSDLPKISPVKEYMDERWRQIINDATDIDRMIRNNRWSVYNSAKIDQVRNQAKALEDRRVAQQVATGNQNAALSKQAAQTQAYYMDALRRVSDYGGGGEVTVSIGSGTSGAPGTSPGGSASSCTTWICLYTNQMVRAVQEQRVDLLKFVAPSDRRAVTVGLRPDQVERDNAERRRQARGGTPYDPARPVAPIACCMLMVDADPAVSDPGVILTEIAGNNALLDLGWMAKGDKKELVLYVSNSFPRAVALTTRTSGSKVSASLSYNGSASFQDEPVLHLSENEAHAGGYLKIRFDAADIDKQDMQTITLLIDGEQFVDLTIDYFLVQDREVSVSDALLGFVSGLGKDFGNEYTLNTGPAPLHYTLSGVALGVFGQHDHRCAEPDRSGDQYAKCKDYRTDDLDVSRGILVQGVEGAAIGPPPDTTVVSSAYLTAKYRLVPDRPVLSLPARN